jgi:DNA-binding MarR family transcriptional regulator
MIEQQLFTAFNLMHHMGVSMKESHMRALNYIKINDGKLTATDIKKELNYPFSTASQICGVLCKGHSYKSHNGKEYFRKGLEFVAQEINPKDKRHKNLVMTKKGKDFFSSLERIRERDNG